MFLLDLQQTNFTYYEESTSSPIWRLIYYKLLRQGRYSLI